MPEIRFATTRASVLILSVLLSACSASDTQSGSDAVNADTGDSITGMIDVPGGRVFYEMYHADAPGIPIIMIHGGPGSTSCTFGVLDEFITGRPVIRYDQLDTGLSERPDNRENWILPRFVREIEAVRTALSLDEVHVLGLSWGGTIVAEFALEGDTEGVLSVILAGPLLSTPIWLEDAKILLEDLPPELQDTIRRHEAAGTTTHPDYIAATDSFYARFLYHQQPPVPVPECDGVSGNPEMYNAMWGPTEFSSTGTLLEYDRSSRLHEIELPVLLIAGEFDEARPETMYKFAEDIADVDVVIIPDAGHYAMIDRPELYANALKRFMSEIEARQ